ncbi:hypothetical protein JZU57_00780, partial [bacterium]|nr:hypothetical protein [bacterium]
RESVLSLDVWDSLTPTQRTEAQRNFYDLDGRITKRLQEQGSASATAQKAAKQPYQDALDEVDSEIKRLDAISGPDTEKVKALRTRRENLKEALFAIGHGNAPDKRLLKAKTATAAAPVASPEALRAQADLQAALADLGDIFGKNTRLNMMPEQEAKILPVMVKLFDAAFRLGYHKFKDAAKFALDKIRTALGDSVADDITLEHLQGA